MAHHLKRAPLVGQKLDGHGADGTPTAEQLGLINKLTLRTLSAEEVYVRTAYVAHNAIDRDREVFDEALLEDFANTLPGKGLFVKHPGGWDGDSGPGVGRWFAAWTEEMSHERARELMGEKLVFAPSTDTALLLGASFFVPRTEKNAGLIGDMDAGVAKDVSIGFSAPERVPIAKDDDVVIAHRWIGPGEALETSLVWLGAQPGAGAKKSAEGATYARLEERTDGIFVNLVGDDGATVKRYPLAAGNFNDDEGDDMAGKSGKEEGQGAPEAGMKSVAVAEFKGLEQKAAKFDGALAALGEAAMDDLDGAKRLMEAGRKYRDELVDAAVKGARLKGQVGDSDEDVAAARKRFEALDTDDLAFWAKQYAEAGGDAPTGGISGSDPNPDNTGGQGGKGGGLRDASKTQAALGQKQAA